MKGMNEGRGGRHRPACLVCSVCLSVCFCVCVISSVDVAGCWAVPCRTVCQLLSCPLTGGGDSLIKDLVITWL